MGLSTVAPAAPLDDATIFVAFELTEARWKVGMVLPRSNKMSRSTIDGGDTLGQADSRCIAVCIQTHVKRILCHERSPMREARRRPIRRTLVMACVEAAHLLTRGTYGLRIRCAASCPEGRDPAPAALRLAGKAFLQRGYSAQNLGR